MAKKYDAVVCGAGNSGISAAVQLALNGKKVLLIEQHNMPGGSASSFRRGRGCGTGGGEVHSSAGPARFHF